MVEIKMLLDCCIPRIDYKIWTAIYQLQKQTGGWKSSGIYRLGFYWWQITQGQRVEEGGGRGGEVEGKEREERRAFSGAFLSGLLWVFLVADCFRIFYNRTMESLRILCNVYNFLPVPLAPQQPIPLQPIEQFRQINLLISEFVTTEYLNPKSTFEQLYQFINKEEQVFGPRKFKKMIESISNILFRFLLGKLRKDQTDSVILCLTYYQRYCSKYFTRPIKITIAVIYALTHLKKDNITISENYINEAKGLIRNQEKDIENGEFVTSIRTLLNIMEGVNCLRRGDFTRAKFIFNEGISQLTEKMHEQQSKSKRLAIQTISYFTIVTYYLAQSYLKIADYDRAAYHTTQCKEFAESNLPKAETLVAFLEEGHTYSVGRTVKLGRIENKIERIKSLHFNAHAKSTTNLKENRTHFKITKRQGEAKLAESKVKGQLNNLLTLEEDNEAKLKRKTLKQLRGEQAEKQRKIQHFQQQISCFSQQKQAVWAMYQNERELAQIAEREAQKQRLKQQISLNIWPIVHTLKATKKIQSYIIGFRAIILYETTNKFFKFLYNQVSFKSHLKLFSILRKLRSKLIREMVRSVLIKGVRHQIELSRHKVAGSYHLKVYQVEKGMGVNMDMEIKQEVYKSLQKEEFCFNFQVENGKVTSLCEYIKSLPAPVLSRMKLFCFKLKRRLLEKRGELLIKKKEVNITFNSYYYYLRYLVLITSHKLSDGSYSHFIERIDCARFANSDYNIRLRSTLFTGKAQLESETVAGLLTQQILIGKSRHMKSITLIQKLFRLKLAKLQLRRMKETTHVCTLLFRRNLYSLVTNGNFRTFFIQNLDKLYPLAILSQPNFYNLSFLHKLKAELLFNDNCLEQLLVIKKYFNLRSFAFKFIKKSQEVKLDTKFSTKIKKSLCFAKVTKHYLYRGKLIEGRMMYMLSVKDFQAFPRPYLLRVFTFEHKNLYRVDFQQIVFNSEKIYLQSNLEKIEQIIDIQDQRRANILEGPVKLNYGKMRRPNSKSTMISNFSFGSGQDFLRQRQSRLNSRLLQHPRQSNLLTRNKKNSINFKMRHKSALKQKDILLIKKWIQDSKQDSSISQSQESSSC